MTCPCEGWVFGGMAGKRMTAKEKTPEALPPRALPGLFSRLTWLSLVGVHPCRAQLRFTRQTTVYIKPLTLAHTRTCEQSSKIDQSAYRVTRLKIDQSAYRVDARKQARFTLDKSESLV